jgi:hypothetical protein
MQRIIKQTANSASEALEILWQEGVFKSWQKFNQIAQILGNRGNNFSKPELGLALRRAKFLTRHGKRGQFEYIQRTPHIKYKTVEKIESIFLPNSLLKKLSKEFFVEISDLKLNFGKSGTCTAFLIRKILEKLIFLTFAKNGLETKLKDRKGKFYGLENMINLASSEKVEGLHFLMPKTADNVKGIKFLGDTSAHNPLTNVDMKTIIPQMPFIITAYEELAKKL